VVTGIYLTLEQNRWFAPVAQEGSFEFGRCPAPPAGGRDQQA